MKKQATDLLLLAGLFLFSVLCFSGKDADISYEDAVIVLPPIIGTISSVLRWITFGIIGILAASRFNAYKNYGTAPQTVYCFFYGTLFLISLANGDLIRYTLMLLAIILIPWHVAYTVTRYGIEKIVSVLFSVSFFLVVLGAVVNFMKGGLSIRYTGLGMNPNAFVGINIFFLITALAALLSSRASKAMRILILSTFVFTAFTQLLAGSRNGFIALLILVFAFSFETKKMKYFLGISLLLGFALLIFNAVGLESAERIFNLSSATSDSGRSALWSKTWEWVEKSPLIGWGTDSRTELTGSGNIHNMYVALFLFGGYFIGGIMCILFILGALLSLRSPVYVKRSPYRYIYVCFAVYPLILAIMSFGEDAPLGVGAPWFAYLLISLGLISGIQASAKLEHTKNFFQKFRP